jgi:hypothetical protein
MRDPSIESMPEAGAEAEAKPPVPREQEPLPSPPAKAVLIGDEDITGGDKWLGGELGADGIIYGVAGSAKTILKIDPATDTVSLVGHCVKGVPCSQKKGRFKWLRGARAENGDTYGVPSNADCVLRISKEGEVSTFGDRNLLEGYWKWHGGVLAPNGNLYSCPCNSDRVLKIVPETLQLSLVGEPHTGKNKWYGALLGHDGCMYCVPNCSEHVLRFDTATETTELLGELPGGGWKWHGGAIGGDGNIYCVPAHATSILKICVGTGEVKQIGEGLPATKYKWGGACANARGELLFFPSDTGRVLKLDPWTEEVTMIGPVFEGKNKWQNGFLGTDLAVYGLPCNAQAVLRISNDDEVTTVGGPWEGAEKWEGGVAVPDETTGLAKAIYGIPQQAGRVLKIVPGPGPNCDR